MNKEVLIHNEVILVGRIISKQKNVKCNNRDTTKVKLAIPDDDREDSYNVANVYIFNDGNIEKNLKHNQAIAISGHIESRFGQKIIADVVSFIKEANI